MPRFSVAFTKRKSTSEGLDHVTLPSPEGPSFRVIDRTELAGGTAFDGGAKMGRASKSLSPKTNFLDLGAQENMFADLKVNRASNVSNTTKGTSTDNSSRHSNASTAPSSADMSGTNGHDDVRPPQKTAPQESPSQSSAKSIGAGLLDRATRTFSFGGQKKQSIPPPVTQDPIPDVPPVLYLARQSPDQAVPRGMTASTASTVTPDNQEGGGMDLGGDFGSMFKGFDKRASTATLTLAAHDNAAPRSLTGNRYGTPGPLSPDNNTPTDPLLSQRHSPAYGDAYPSPTSPHDDGPPSVPRHEHLNSFKYSDRPTDIMEDEDAKFLRESVSAMRFLTESRDSPTHDPDASGIYQKDENMFEGNMSRSTRTSQRYTLQSSNAPRNKVMTSAQFEKYRRDKELAGPARETRNNPRPATQKVDNDNNDDDDGDDINYDDDEDEQEKSKQQTKQRRKQEAHMAVYRQQMMKVTGETGTTPTPLATKPTPRSALPPSSSTPAGLLYLKTPSPDPAVTNASSEEDDEDVPLAILQAHGFPNKNRPPNRLSPSGSNPNLPTSMAGPSSARPTSLVVGDTATVNTRRHTNLPAFARNLPQDPFLGASIARPAIRESLHFGDAKRQPSPQPQPGFLPSGGLVGVIASEERSRAMRRGSPSVDANKLIGGAVNPNGTPVGQDPFVAMPAHTMYNTGGMSGMSPMQQMAPPMLTPGDQVQIQMTQQMTQFMQMQMQFMQMMATNQNGGAQLPQQQPAMQPPFAAGLPGNQSMGDLNRQSVMMEPPHLPHPHARTMSMVQPSSSSFMAPFEQSIPSIRGVSGAYAQSIAPSERSNVGLPGRYRPVSQALGTTVSSLGQHVRSNTISGDLSNWSDDKSKSTVKLMSSSRDSREVSDDDEEQGWEAMKAKREKKRSLWRSKRVSTDELNVAF